MNAISSINLGVKSNLFRIDIEYNRKNMTLVRYFYRIGLLNSYSIEKNKRKVTIYFCYYYNKKPIRCIKRVSTSGRKVYISYCILKKLLTLKKQYLILSTDKGILNNREAISKKVGGELLFVIQC